MKIKFLGSGPSTCVPKSPTHPLTGKFTGKSRRMQSSMLIDNRLLVDATQQIEKQLKDKTIEAVLISHAHKDAYSGLKVIDKFIKTKPIPVYSFSHTIKLLQKRVGKKDFIKYFVLKPYKTYNILGYKVTPYPVKHSILPLFDPTISFKINNIIYSEDIDQDFLLSNVRRAKKLKLAMKKSTLTILDGAMCKGKLRGHCTIWDVIPALTKEKIRHVYFTQIGNTCPRYETLLKQIKEMNPNYRLCYDGMVLNIKRSLETLISISRDMDLTELTKQKLLFVHSVLHKWYKTDKESWSKEDIWNLHKRVVGEMKKQDIEHIPKDNLDKELRIQEEEVKNVLDNLDDFTIMKDAVSIVGSFIETDKHNDLDILIKPDSIDYIQRAIESRIAKKLPEQKLHTVIDPGPHDSYIPLYDLVLKRTESHLIEMQEELAIPQKPFGEAYYDMKTMIKEMFKKPTKWIVEKKWDGFHVMVRKRGETVTISTEKKNITKGLPTLAESIKKLSKSDFIINGELIYVKDGKLGTRRDLMPFVVAKVKPDDRKTKLVVWDITYFDKPTTQLPLIERKKILRGLNFSERIKQTQWKLIDSPAMALQAIRKMSNMPRSEGAIVKQFDSKYLKGEKSKIWLKYRKMSDLHGRVLDVHTTPTKAYNYLIGVDLSKADLKNVNPKYIKNNILVLGRTFNTKVKCSVNDIIDVKVEEVWRHEGPDGIRYSIHKPRFQTKRPDLKSTSTLANLDSIVVSLGIAVKEGIKVLEESIKTIPIELQEKPLTKSLTGPDGKEIRDFPKSFQDDFKIAMEKKLKPRFVMQHHERGKSCHTDLRCDIPNKGYLRAFTIASPASVTDEDKVTNEAKSVLIPALKPKIPRVWLKVEGESKTGEPGATEKLPGIFTIVAKGTYEVYEVTDHKIGLIFNCDKGKISKVKGRIRREPDNLKQLTGEFSITIAHIGARHLCYFNHLKSKKIEKVSITPYEEELLEDLTIALSPKRVKHLIQLDTAIVRELGEFKLPYFFRFAALTEGRFNGIFYPKEELRKPETYNTLLGVDITTDHGKSVRDVVGKVVKIWWNEKTERIEGIGKINEEEIEIAKKIHNGSITGVSVEVYVDYVRTTKGLSAKFPEFVALSLVRKPACKPPVCGIENGIHDIEAPS